MPFQHLRYYAHLGGEVCAFGFPIEQLQADVPAREVFRFFRGNIQRPLTYSSVRSGHKRYSAYELSFPAPSGLSGGPVFPASDPLTLMAIVTENLEATTIVTEVVVEEAPDRPLRVETTKRVVSYGIAANIFNASGVLETVLGGPLPVRYSDATE